MNAQHRAAIENAVQALDSLIKWDMCRRYIVPYKVRDPIHASISSLSAMLAEKETDDERDAKRYRWLRDQAENFAHEDGRHSPWAVIGADAGNNHPCSYEALDSAIDAAIASQGTKP